VLQRDRRHQRPLHHIVEANRIGGAAFVRLTRANLDDADQPFRQLHFHLPTPIQLLPPPLRQPHDAIHLSPPPDPRCNHRQSQYKCFIVTMQEVTRRDQRLPEAEWFGATIRRLREERGLTQATLAEAASLSTTYLGILER